MRFACPILEEPIKLEEGKINVLVVENPVALRNLVKSIVEFNSDVVLSDDYKPVELSKHMEFINNIFDVNFISKNITSKINNEINSLSLSFQKEINELYEALNSFGSIISSNLDFPATFSYVQEFDRVTKMLNFTFDTDGMDIPEKLLEYMNICRKFYGKKVFVFLNLKCFFSCDELTSFYKNIAYEGYRILLIESYDANHINEFENTVVIDSDLCII